MILKALGRLFTATIAISGLMATPPDSIASAYTVERSVVVTPAKVPVWIALPDQAGGKVPAVLLVHGSGGINHDHERGYAKFFSDRGIATIVIDSFVNRGIKSTVTDQAQLPARAMTRDALQVLQSLIEHPKIDVDRVAIMGFSKGAQASLLSSLMIFNRPGEKRFALTIAMYPPCNVARFRPTTTGRPIRILVGARDAYNEPAPCYELEKELKAEGADVALTTIPNAKHGWDVPRNPPNWQNAKGENYSKCRFIETAPGRWVERTSQIEIENNGRPIPENRKKALSKCIRYGVSGGYNPEAAKQSIRVIESELRALTR
ncbi:MAG: dienelactone hydrolase family protein [Rhizobiaceae bacterium]